MRAITALCIAALTLGGCAHFEHSVTGPSGYKFVESGTAIGGGAINKLVQGIGGTLEVYGPDGKPLVKATLDSMQEAEGIQSDAESLMRGIALLGKLAKP